MKPDPGDPGGVLAFGRAALRTGDEEAALPLVAAAAGRNPDHIPLLLLLARLNRQVERLGPAIAAVDQAAALAPEDAGIAREQARLHGEAGRPALALFDRALALAPGEPAARFGRVSALLAERGSGPAIEALEQALAETPSWAEGQKRLADLRWQAGDRDGFTRTLEAALAAAPRQLGLWGSLLTVLSDAGAHAALRDAARRGRTAAGGHAMFDVYEAAALDALGETGEASLLFEAMGETTDPVAAHFQLRHLLRLGRIEDGAALAEGWLDRPGAEAFVAYLGACWRLLGDERAEWLEGDSRLVTVCDLDPGPLEALAGVLRVLHRERGQPLDQSVRGGSQTDGALFGREEPEVQQLRAAVAAAVERHVAQLPPPAPAHPTLSARRDRPVRFAGSWSVRLTGAGHHAVHRHQQGWLSSACYVKVPADAERGPAPAGWLALGEPPPELGLGLEPRRLIEPVPGRLVLFPSTMWHGTRPFSAGERLTVAFDVARPR